MLTTRRESLSTAMKTQCNEIIIIIIIIKKKKKLRQIVSKVQASSLKKEYVRCLSRVIS